MDLGGLIRARIARGAAAVGPNEARLLFDLVSALGASAVSMAFSALFLSPKAASWWDPVLLATPWLFLGLNWLGGIYTRLKMAAPSLKVLVITGAVVLTAVVLGLLSANLAGAVLWALIVWPPVVLARILLGLPLARQRAVAGLVVNRRGPVVVIGGAGYIGTYVVEILLEKGYRVRVLDRLMYGREPLADFVDRPAFELIEGDATDINKLVTACRNASTVIHLAGLVGDPACSVDLEFTRHANIVATRMAKEVAQSLGIYRFVFASSCSVYGISDSEVDERGALNPVSLYAQTKIDSEEQLLYALRDDFFVTVLRFATVFGHSRRPRFDLVANLFTAQAMTEGRITVIGPGQWRPFIHVRDVARAVVLAVEADPRKVQSQVFNVGDRRLNMTIGQLGEVVRSVASGFRDVDLLVREQAAEDRRNYAVSFEKIHSYLGFEAATGIEDGVREMAVRFADDRYRHYREELYSNVAVTRREATAFHDPQQTASLYGPLRTG